MCLWNQAPKHYTVWEGRPREGGGMEKGRRAAEGRKSGRKGRLWNVTAWEGEIMDGWGSWGMNRWRGWSLRPCQEAVGISCSYPSHSFSSHIRWASTMPWALSQALTTHREWDPDLAFMGLTSQWRRETCRQTAIILLPWWFSEDRNIHLREENSSWAHGGGNHWVYFDGVPKPSYRYIHLPALGCPIHRTPLPWVRQSHEGLGGLS